MLCADAQYGSFKANTLRGLFSSVAMQQVKSAQLIGTAVAQTLQMINEYFGVGVVSESRMTSAGVEPWMGSSTG